jgi:hypothetical protein
MSKMDAQELKWRAQSDAETLKRAMEIQQDKNRKKMAQAEINAELKRLQALAGTKAKPKAPAKPKAKATPKKKK